jgi:hypothetical protein
MRSVELFSPFRSQPTGVGFGKRNWLKSKCGCLGVNGCPFHRTDLTIFAWKVGTTFRIPTFAQGGQLVTINRLQGNQAHGLGPLPRDLSTVSLGNSPNSAL